MSAPDADMHRSMCRFNQIIPLKATTTAPGDLFNDVIWYFLLPILSRLFPSNDLTCP